MRKPRLPGKPRSDPRLISGREDGSWLTGLIDGVHSRNQSPRAFRRQVVADRNQPEGPDPLACASHQGMNNQASVADEGAHLDGCQMISSGLVNRSLLG